MTRCIYESVYVLVLGCCVSAHLSAFANLFFRTHAPVGISIPISNLLRTSNAVSMHPGVFKAFYLPDYVTGRLWASVRVCVRERVCVSFFVCLQAATLLELVRYLSVAKQIFVCVFLCP